MKLFLTGWVSSCLLVLAACQMKPAPQAPVVDAVMATSSGQGIMRLGGRKVPGEELERRLSGKSLTDVYRTFTWTFEPDGTYAWGGGEGDRRWSSTGTWEIRGDAFCWTLDNWDMGCRPVYDAMGILRIGEEDGDTLEPWGIF